MENMQAFIIGIVVVSITLVIGIYIASQIQTTLITSTGSAVSAPVNAAGQVVVALSNGTPWITILVVVGFAVIVLGMLTQGFGQAASGGPVY